MKPVVIALGVLLALGAAAEQHPPAPEPDIWERVLAWLGWGKDAPLITRGSRVGDVDGLGELWYVDHRRGTPTPAGIAVLLRSPLLAGDGRTVYALTDDNFLAIDLDTAKAVSLGSLPSEHQPVRLLRRHDGVVFALSADGCLVGSSGEPGATWQVRTCALSDRQRSELIDRARLCGDVAAGERYETGPPSRVDIFIRRGRISQRLTDAPSQRANYDPALTADCSRIYFVSRDRK